MFLRKLFGYESNQPLPFALLVTICISLLLITVSLLAAAGIPASELVSDDSIESHVSVTDLEISETEIASISPVSLPSPSPTPLIVGNNSQYSIKMQPSVSDAEQTLSLLSASFMFSELTPPDNDTDYSQLIDDGALDAVSFNTNVFTLTNDIIYTDDSRIPSYSVPDADTDPVGTLSRDSEYLRIAVSDSGWSMVQYRSSDRTVYVETSRIHTMKPMGEIAAQPTPVPPAPDISPTPYVPKSYNSDGLYLYREVRGISVYVDSEVSEAFIKRYIKDIEELPALLANPESIRSINITTKDLKAKFPSLSNIKTRVIGVTNPGTRAIWINGNLYSRNTILHESIHVWDVITNNNLSAGTDFQKIYAAEKSAVSVSPGNYVNAMEFLASSAELYYDNPTRLKKAAPQTYSFLQKYLD